MIQVAVENSFESWRKSARDLLAAEIEPNEIVWLSASQNVLFEPSKLEPRSSRIFSIHPDFIELARSVACHNSDEKWPLLYRLLFRLIYDNRNLLEIESDIDVRDARLMAKSVSKDIHKFHAFVRFRRVECDGREIFFAWHEPYHFTVEPATPFFTRRFGSMRFSILSPKGCAHWDLEKLSFSPAVEKLSVPDSDDTEDFWLAYYKAIFNPFRLKIKAMKKEMPVRHWRTLPETVLIDSLIRDSRNG